MNEIRDTYLENVFLGYRKITALLIARGYEIGRKRVRRLMALCGLKAVVPKHRTSVSNKSHAVYPYLLRGLNINRPNQVWCVDITYLKMAGGFVYLAAIIDAHSRKIMGWELSPFIDTKLCLDALEKALQRGTPEIVNSDQGCQFTSKAWTEELTCRGIAISMDGKRAWLDNIKIERFWKTLKYEDVYLYEYATIVEARAGIARYINFYNAIRPHQALDYSTPDFVYNHNQKGPTPAFPLLGNEETALSNAALILV